MKIFKGLSLGFIALTLVFSMGAGSANAATTFAVNAITESGALTVTSAGALGFVTGTNAINIGADAAAKVITIGNVTGVTAVNINAGTGASTFAVTGAGTLTLGGAAATGIVTVYGGTSAANTLFNNVTGGTIAIGATNTGGINIGTGASAQAITIGSTNTSSTLTLQSGTGGIKLEGHLVSKGAAPTITQNAGAAPTVMATNTDNAGWFRTNTTAHTNVIITFAQAYTNAPHCTFSPDNAAAAILQLTSPGVYGTTTTTALTLTHASDTTVTDWNYICLGAE